ncbi:MAG: hypothetical protein LBH94_03805 [Deltaproteobacteria bacterium]|jgi:hypothetical protein|nr:hypothetical protein [Deltaproteobacteria bacterium]
MKKLITRLCLSVVLLGATAAYAGSVKEYSASMVDVASGRVAQKIAVAPDKVYSEGYNEQGELKARIIIRLDRRKMHFILEDSKSYAELPFNKSSFSTVDFTLGMIETVKKEELGTQTVNGYKAVKYGSTVKVSGTSLKVFQWIAPEFDPMPIRVEVNGVVREMRDIQISSPEVSLFELPDGYTRNMKMEDAVKNMMGM